MLRKAEHYILQKEEIKLLIDYRLFRVLLLEMNSSILVEIVERQVEYFI
jgi:hypothetical protein